MQMKACSVLILVLLLSVPSHGWLRRATKWVRRTYRKVKPYVKTAWRVYKAYKCRGDQPSILSMRELKEQDENAFNEKMEIFANELHSDAEDYVAAVKKLVELTPDEFDHLQKEIKDDNMLQDTNEQEVQDGFQVDDLESELLSAIREKLNAEK